MTPHVTVMSVNTLKPRQNGCIFADDIFKRIFFNENVWISITISLKFVPKCPNNNMPALVQIMTWRRPGDKPLSEPMLVGSLTHICVTRPQWIKTNWCSLSLFNVSLPADFNQHLTCEGAGVEFPAFYFSPPNPCIKQDLVDMFDQVLRL